MSEVAPKLDAVGMACAQAIEIIPGPIIDGRQSFELRVEGTPPRETPAQAAALAYQGYGSIGTALRRAFVTGAEWAQRQMRGKG